MTRPPPAAPSPRSGGSACSSGAGALCERVRELDDELGRRAATDDPRWDDPIGPTGLAPLVAATRERLRAAGATRA